ncbi:ABC transporter substrate-binding protein [Streptomyces sp. NPDC059866]|uniref:ABC transporter substrate-binding protein n=1 Tax=Streptomyces sp. NPDC059866 TaxID=3346978 RepID=UPI003652D354
MRRKPQSRIALAAAGLLVAAVAACGGGDDTAQTASAGDGRNQETLKVMMFPAQAYRLPVLVGQEQGLFEKRGIKLEITEQPTNLQGMQGLEATSSDIGQVSVSTLAQGYQAGTEGAYFCGALDVIQTTLMAAKNSKLPSTGEGASWQEVLRALEGKKIGIQTPVGSGVQLLFAAALKEAGVTDVTYVNIGTAPSAVVAALGNGSVDAAQISPTGTQFMLDADSGKPLVYLPDGPETYKSLYGSGWVAPTEFLKGRPEAAKAFCDVMGEALEFIQDPANTEASASILAEDTGVTPEVAQLVVEQTYDDHSTELDKARLERTFDTYVDLGILKAQPEPSYDTLVVSP